MKKLYLLIGIVAFLATACEKEDVVVPLEPQEDPLAEVIRIAQEGAAMLGDAETRSAVGRRIDRSRISCKINPATRAGESDDTLYYVVNYADNAGFTIVSANEEAPDGARLIAVTESGSYTAGETTDNEGFNMYMDMVERSAGTYELIKDTLPLIPSPAPRFEREETYSPWYGVNPLVQVKWGQGYTPFYLYNYPYNKYCIDNNSMLCPAGCVAVAIAQIMSYHRKPSSYMLTYDGSDHIIPLDWDVLNSNVGGPGFNWTEQEGNDIALWFREIGKRASMDYTPDNSFSGYQNARVALHTFGYEQVGAVDYSYTKIHTELHANRPVYMEGMSYKTANDGAITVEGHAWVADGYKYRTCDIKIYLVYPSLLGEEYDRKELYSERTETYRYVHYNWGYDGVCNGFFKDEVFRLNNASSEAGGYDNSGSNSLDANYSYDVKMVTEIANYHSY